MKKVVLTLLSQGWVNGLEQYDRIERSYWFGNAIDYLSSIWYLEQYKQFGYEGANVTVYMSRSGVVCAVSAYDEQRNYVDLTDQVREVRLDYTLGAGKWAVYALFMDPIGQYTNRSLSGEKGFVPGYFNRGVTETYLKSYDPLFELLNLLRSTFNDSYEVDGADFSPAGISMRWSVRMWYSMRGISLRWRIVRSSGYWFMPTMRWSKAGIVNVNLSRGIS